MKKVYVLNIDPIPLEKARNFGRKIREWGDHISNNPFTNGSDEHLEFQMGYYEKDCLFGKTEIE